MKSTDQDLVVKSNRLIEASYRLDLIEQRIILAAIVEARETGQGLSKGFVSISAPRFAEMFGMDPKAVYGQLKQALEKLYERSIQFYDIDPATGEDRSVSSRWITDRAMVNKPGIIQLRFNPTILPFITRLEEEFTSYRLERIGRMTSQHAIRLYELLLQYEKIGQRIFPLDEFRRVLQITDMYEKLSALKRYLLEPAVKQINEFTDLEVSWAERKVGRSVAFLVFDIAMKPMTPRIADAKAKNPSKKPKTVTEYELSQLARPGESYADAMRRLNVTMDSDHPKGARAQRQLL